MIWTSSGGWGRRADRPKASAAEGDDQRNPGERVGQTGGVIACQSGAEFRAVTEGPGKAERPEPVASGRGDPALADARGPGPISDSLARAEGGIRVIDEGTAETGEARDFGDKFDPAVEFVYDPQRQPALSLASPGPALGMRALALSSVSPKARVQCRATLFGLPVFPAPPFAGMLRPRLVPTLSLRRVSSA